MHVRAYAKINWALRVVGKRGDGYHELETLFQSISLCDTLAFEPATETSLECDDPAIPVDETNLVLRAVRALGAPPVRIVLQKRIPAGGGLGGGSSDAAATLVALSRMFGIEAPLHERAISLGSDVPFFLAGGTAYASGRGEILSRLPDAAPIPLVLVFPEERVATAEAFRAIRRYSAPLGFERYRAMVDGDLLAHDIELVNDFEEPIFDRLPQLGELKVRLYELGAAWAAMSGSGSTVVGAFRSQAARDEALGALSGVRAVAAETIGRAAAVSA